VRTTIFAIGFILTALLAGLVIAHYPPTSVLFGMLTLVIFTLAFVNIEWGLYILIFSMLLSPELLVGGTDGASLDRGITLRLEDFLLVVIGLSWFARNAIFKDLGLLRKTPLNRAIFIYVLACTLSTGYGVMAGRVDPLTGGLFVVKYIEYFVVFFMLVNHVRTADQIRRFVVCLFVTAAIVAVIGICQVPGGDRVTAPFEGASGEPNTFGGYLLFIGMAAAGMLAKSDDRRIRQILFLLILLLIPPFLFTQSRSSYLAFIPACLTLGLMADKRIIILALLALAFLVSPLFLPLPVKNRIMYTFTQPESEGQIVIGDIRLDTSTSARIRSWQEVLRDWSRHPLLGYGVTGYHFVDAQFPRVLIETGILGMAAFLYLIYCLFKTAVFQLRGARSPFFKGIGVGFIAGLVGLMVHAIGANTFIIVRIMEPFWFFAGIVVLIPELETGHLQAEENLDRSTGRTVPV
jgi:hypothetical protein